MDKIASPQALQAELRRLIDHCQASEPSRQKLATALHKLADQVSPKTAHTGYDILLGMIPVAYYHRLHDRLTKEDDQSAKLMTEVFSKLSDELNIDRGAQEALGRMKDITGRGQRWDVSLLRNNIFKAADALGIRLPSHNF